MLCYKHRTDTLGNYSWQFKKPWETFTENTRTHLETTIVSFKQNIRVLNKTVNYYQKYVDGKKVLEKQVKGDNWAIRKSLHKDTVSGLVKLKFKKIVQLSAAIDIADMIVSKSLKQKIAELKAQKLDKKQIQKFFKDNENKWEEIDISKVEIYYWEVDENGIGINAASRVSLNDTFNADKIKTITDFGIQKILFAHLEKYKGRMDDKGKEIAPELLAFSPEGIEEMNKTLPSLNNEKSHKPIYKIRTYSAKGEKFCVGHTGNKKDKFVVADSGTNLYFAIYRDSTGKRNYATIPLIEVIERLKQGLSPMPEKEENTILFHLSPNDLVYVPSPNEQENLVKVDFKNLTMEQSKRIYRFIDGSGTTANFVPVNISSLIFNLTKKDQERLKISYPIQNEFGLGSPQSKNQNSIDGIQVKSCCWKLEIDKLGKVKKIIM
jgi:CRISPR-associated endonuclease Csn1